MSDTVTIHKSRLESAVIALGATDLVLGLITMKPGLESDTKEQINNTRPGIQKLKDAIENVWLKGLATEPKTPEAAQLVESIKPALEVFEEKAERIIKGNQ